MGSTHLFTLQQALKLGVFYWLRIQNSNHLHTELSLGYLKDTKFFRESKPFLFTKAVLLHLRWLPRVITNTVLIERELENETLSISLKLSLVEIYQYGYC